MKNSTITLRQKLNSLIQAIRKVPGYEDFLSLPTYETVRHAACSEKPLIYLITTPTGSLALIITPETTQPIWLDDLTQSLLLEILYGSVNTPDLNCWFGAFQHFRKNTQSNYLKWCDEIDHSTRRLWEPLMKPLIQALRNLNVGQAILIPTGLLSFLPLHSIWTPDSTRPTNRLYALDEIHFTYAPNAKSLIAAKAIVKDTPADSILAIDNPQQNLPNSEKEINAAVNSFNHTAIFRCTEATISNVKSQLREKAIVHFSCHGTANLNDPLNSGLELHDGRLTLKDIFALNLTENGGIRLAVLSACETGVQSMKNVDEAIGLPTGLLQAGVAAVIASLWSVSDFSTMVLLTRFYDLWRKDGLPTDQALHKAQIWLRDSTKGEIATYLGFRTDTPDDRPYAHPFHWAAFGYTGI